MRQGQHSCWGVREATLSTFHKDDGAENQLQTLFASLRRDGWPPDSHRNVVERQPKHVVLNEETVAKGLEHKGLIEPMRRVIIHLCRSGGVEGVVVWVKQPHPPSSAVISQQIEIKH